MASERTSSYRQSDAETIARFEAAAKSATVVSFDLFDTLVTRPLARPIDLFSAMQPHLPEAWAPAAGDFGSARVAAEMAARETAALAGRRDVTLAEIYDALAGATGIDRAALDALAALETRFEVAATRADPAVVGAFDRLVAAGKRVIVVTDMYLPRETIEAILAASGIAGFERVFISAETDAPKGDGSAWAHVRHALGLAATDAIVHIGDNPGSDGRAAERAGVGAFVLTPPQERRARGWTYRPGDWLTEAFAALGAQAERHDDDPETAYWRRLGYGLVAPSALAMAAFILTEARGRSSERVHFLARDGLVFRQAYDVLFAEADAPPSNYLWASRRCFNFAAIDQLDKDSMEFLVGSLTRIRVRDFLVRVGIDPDEDAVRREIEARLPSADQTVERGHEWDALRDLFRALWPRVRDTAAAERAVLLDYLGGSGVFDERSLVVDLGWRGSLQRGLVDLGRRFADVDPAVHGAYLGTYPYRAGVADPFHDRISGFLFAAGEPSGIARAIRESVEVVELLFSAPQPGISSIRREGDGFRPVLVAMTRAEERRHEIARILHEAVRDAAEALAGIADVDALVGLRPALSERFEKLLLQPQAEDVRHFGPVEHADGFGEAPYRPIVPRIDRLPFGRMHPFFRAVYWKPAFLSTLTPGQRLQLNAEAAVRTVRRRLKV